jgi:hypothetical protein
MRVNRVYQGYQRKGFFRIGALPTGIVEGVELDLYAPEAIGRALRQCERLPSGGALEIQNLTVSACGLSTNFLSCRYARPLTRHSWQLEGKVRFTHGLQSQTGERGLLFVDWPGGPLIVFPGAEPGTNHLFAIENASTPP